jgi:MFS family permease
LWRNHDFLVLWTGETVSTLGSSMSFFVFPLIGYLLTGSTTQAALAGSAFALGSVLAKLPAGALVDRWNRKHVLAGSNWLGALLYASLVAALLADRLTIGHLVAVALLTGVVGSFFRPAETAAIRAVVPRRQLPTAFSQNQARQHVAALVGPPLGGALYAATRWAPFLVDAVTFAASALAIGRIRAPLTAPETAAPSTGMLHDIGEGLRFMMSRGFLRAIVAFAALANFAGQAFFLVLTLKLLEAGVHPAAIGLIDTIGAVAGIAGAVAAPWLVRKVPSGALAIGMGLLLVVAVVPMAFTDSVLLIGGLLAVALLGNPAGNVSVTSYLVATTPDHLQGRCQAALGFCTSALMPIGPVLGGAAMARWGGEKAMLLAAGLLAVAVLPLVLSGDTRRLSTPDRWPEVLSGADRPMTERGGSRPILGE